ncbi:DUF4832 domain-containing protein [Vibrio hepatarius]|uniref:DUF4832 domain-containing protein n=1 Tax=Vibrio hepatarius TaxID=171383 RepID=UPI0037360F92
MKKKRISTLVLTCLVGGASVAPFAMANQDLNVQYPKEIDSIIVNPGVGIEAFHNGWGSQLTSEQYPETGIDYYRFYWNEIEPQEGQFNFEMIDSLFQMNQSLPEPRHIALRFMTMDEPYSGTKIPNWLVDKGIKGKWVSNGKTFVPDLDDSTYLYYVKTLLDALGQRYDGNKHLAHVDIGMAGSWGEWHNSNFSELPPLNERYSPEQLNYIVDLHFQAFPKTNKIMLINAGEPLAYAVGKGAGWRADCLGDWHHFSTTWSHMDDDYPYRIGQAEQTTTNFDNAWQHAPVSFEVCGNMQGWLNDQKYTREEVKATFDWALENHASSINLKSLEVPAEYRDIVDNAMKKLGFRFRVNKTQHPYSVNQNETLVIESEFINEGVAPTYQPYAVHYRLISSKGVIIPLGKDSQNTEEWLPGTHVSKISKLLPNEVQAGTYSIEIALLNDCGEEGLTLANEGQQQDGWYQLSTIEVRSAN